MEDQLIHEPTKIKDNNNNLKFEEEEQKEIVLNFDNCNNLEIKQDNQEKNEAQEIKEENQPTKEIKRKRNYGIDLLRIISMFFVCLLHTLFRGGILDEVKIKSTNYFFAWFLEISAFCAVDSYALISGYVGVSSKCRLANFAYLWLQVEFYSLGILFVSAIIKQEMFTGGDFYEHVFPITKEKFWYFSAYLGLYIVMPYLNFSLNNMPKNVVKWNLIIGLLIIMIFSRLNDNFIYLLRGYSSFWLIILYIVGGYIKKYEPFKKVKKLYLILLWIICIVITWVVKISIEISTESPGSGDILISYLSITIFTTAIILLELFSRITFNKNPKIIQILSVSSFGAFLIHTHTASWDWLNKRFVSFSYYNPILFLLATLGIALTIYIICSIIDYLRYLLFELIKVKTFLLKLEEKFNKKFIDITT